MDESTRVAPRYTTVGDAATWIAVTERTIRDWVKAGRLKGYRFGPGTLRIDLNELEALGGVHK